MRSRFIIISLLLADLFIGCTEDNDSIIPKDQYRNNLPRPFPVMHYPEDNAFTEERWALGKKLFYDSILSIDGTLSCASCHKPELAFSDDVKFSKGAKEREGIRNSPSLANIGYHPYFTREGGVPTLEQQVLVPLQEHNEFDFNILLAGERIANDSAYVKMSLSAYNRTPDYYVITRALGNFQRSLISNTSNFDQYYFDKQSEALSKSQERGLILFYSEKTNCFKCHSGPNFTNYSFENNGLYEDYSDEGRHRLTGEDSDKGKFKVPSLRNIEITGPYMHDGAIGSLEKVIDHYDSGGNNHLNQNSLIRPLNLTVKEKNDLLAFLLSLTDDNFLINPKFSK